MAIQIPRDLGFNEIGWRRLVDAVYQLVEGRNNAVGRFTLRAGFTTTVVTHPNCSMDCEPQYSPRTANASAEVGNGTIRISSVDQGSFTLTHANNGQTDRTFGYTVTGG